MVENKIIGTSITNSFINDIFIDYINILHYQLIPNSKRQILIELDTTYATLYNIERKLYNLGFIKYIIFDKCKCPILTESGKELAKPLNKIRSIFVNNEIKYKQQLENEN